MDWTAHIGCIAAGAGLILAAVVFGALRRLLRQKARQAAGTDPVTGCLTEEAFLRRADHVLSGKARQFALISVQVCALPQIGRIHGWEAADRVLVSFSAVLRAQLGNDALIARTGEDTFCFLLKNRSTDEIRAKLATLSQASRSAAESAAFFPEPRFGVCLPDDNRESPREILRRAALSRPQALSDGSCAFYDAEQSRAAERGRELAASIGSALEKGEFTVWLQPRVRVSDQRVAGAEALVRWRHPRLGILSPEMFLPAAQEHCLIAAIDRFILEEVCRLHAQRSREGLEPCPISVNLSRMSVQDASLPEFCAGLCRRHGVDPSLIELELHESLLTDNQEAAGFLIQQLHAEGFRCILDNFGSGACSLQLLASLDLDAVKLDRSFFSGSNNSRHGRTIIETILRLAAQLHIHTIALGIDNPAQVQYLRQAACDFIQGFHYFKPMPAERFDREVCPDGVLRYVDEPGTSASDKSRRTLPLSAPAQSSGSIIHFTYRPAEDTVEFSEAFSPVLSGSTYFENALALMRTTDLIHDNDRKDFFLLLERCQRETGWVTNTLRFYTAQGRYEWLELRLHQDAHSAEKAVTGMLVNMSGWKNEVDRWKEKATRDPLTGLYNREYFENTVSNLLSRAAFNSAALLFIDVDFFKQVNDTYGHMVGDDVLCYMAKQLLGIFRHTDIIARYAGDEFVVFAPSIERTVLEDRLGKLYGTFQYPYRSDTISCRISASIGAALFPGDGTDYQTLLDHADCALYESKENGRGRYTIYEPRMQGNSSKD